MTKPLTGRKVFAMFVAFFGTIIAVNVYMATQAVGTFPGLEVKNSYVASQTFDKDRAAQEALGWLVTQGYDGKELSFLIRDKTGLPAKVKVFAAKIGRTTMAREDVEPVYTYKDGFFTAPLTLGKGAWLAHVEAVAEDGTKFKQRLNFFVN